MRSSLRRLAFAGVAVAALIGVVQPSSATSMVTMGRIHYMRPYSHSVVGGITTQSNPLLYGGGPNGIETNPRLYLVFMGWTSDPANVSRYLIRWLTGVGGTNWNSSVTQYCDGVPAGTSNCSLFGGAVYGGNPSSNLYGVWYDQRPAPKTPADHDLAVEALDAAVYFHNRTLALNANAEYIIATPTKQSTNGFGSSFCAWHSTTSQATLGNVAFTNLPYMPDAGSGCGANFVNPGDPGKLDGVSIVEGHEMAETETDHIIGNGWTDAGGAENGDKCAWTGLHNITTSTGTFAVQPLWSNAINGCAG